MGAATLFIHLTVMSIGQVGNRAHVKGKKHTKFWWEYMKETANF